MKKSEIKIGELCQAKLSYRYKKGNDDDPIEVVRVLQGGVASVSHKTIMRRSFYGEDPSKISTEVLIDGVVWHVTEGTDWLVIEQSHPFALDRAESHGRPRIVASRDLLRPWTAEIAAEVLARRNAKRITENEHMAELIRLRDQLILDQRWVIDNAPDKLRPELEQSPPTIDNHRKSIYNTEVRFLSWADLRADGAIMTELREYRITFGLKYARETHPLWLPAHPDGWLTIMAPDSGAARIKAHQILGQYWAFLYGPESDLSLDQFPRGELDRVEAPPYPPRAAPDVKGASER